MPVGPTVENKRGRSQTMGVFHGVAVVVVVLILAHRRNAVCGHRTVSNNFSGVKYIIASEEVNIKTGK